MARTQRCPVFVLGLFLADAGLTLVSLLQATYGALFWKLQVLFDVDAESNLPTWYSSIKLFVIAALLGLVARRNFVRRRWDTWLFCALPLAFLLFSLDEVAMLHDWLGHKLDALTPLLDRQGTAFGLTGFWGLVVGLPIMLGLAGLLMALRRHVRAAPTAWVKIGLGSLGFVAAAAGVDTLQNFVPQSSWGYLLTTHTEEFLEMFCTSIVCWGCWDLLTASGFTIRLEAIERPADPAADPPTARSLDAR